MDASERFPQMDGYPVFASPRRPRYNPRRPALFEAIVAYAAAARVDAGDVSRQSVQTNGSLFVVALLPVWAMLLSV
jgi:hypothetical protein